MLTNQQERSHLSDEANVLLRICTENPTTETLPRVVFTLLDMAPWLDRTALPRVLELLPAAVDWTEAWLVAGKWTEAERPARLRMPDFGYRLSDDEVATLATFLRQAWTNTADLVSASAVAGLREAAQAD